MTKHQMLTPLADGVLVHTSDFLQSNAVVVHGSAGVLLVDPGVRDEELVGLGRELGHPVAAGFSTHPHWDHLLWHADFGTPPRYGTARCAAAIQARLADDNWRAMVSGMLPPDIADQVPLNDHFGRINGLPEGTEHIPWDGPKVRIIEHQAHAPGHAALLIEDTRVLIAGDMLSDVLAPILNGFSPDPIGDYLAALQLLEGVADVAYFVPGHGSVGDGAELRARIDRDRAYLFARRDGRDAGDGRFDPTASK